MGQAVAASLRAVPSKSFDFLVETSHVYARDELIHDVYAKGSTVALVGDPLDGWALEGAHRKPAATASDAHQHFEAGRALCYSPTIAGDSIDSHTLAAFIVTVWQFLPASSAGEEPEVVRAQLRFVHSPGTERLAMDPGLLRIREGTSLNHSLLTFSASVQVCNVQPWAFFVLTMLCCLLFRRCAVQELRATGTRARVDTSKSVLTKLLSHSLGGNAYTLLIGAFAQGEPSESEALLKHMQVCFPSKFYRVPCSAEIRSALKCGDAGCYFGGDVSSQEWKLCSRPPAQPAEPYLPTGG